MLIELRPVDQAKYEAAWYLQTMAVAAEMIHPFQGWDQGKRHAFINWLVDRTNYLIDAGTSPNNHAYWLACLAMAVGILAEDAKLFDYAVLAFKDAIDTEIATDGHLPKETARGYRGIHYQNFAIESLVFLAEMARHQSIDLYSYQVRNVNLKLAVDYLFQYLATPEKWPWSSAKQDISSIPNHFGWVEFAYYHWRDRILMEWLVKFRATYPYLFDEWCGGMTTLTHGLPSAIDAQASVEFASRAIIIAKYEGRTQGLNNSQVLFQQANDSLKAGNYTAATDVAQQAINAANSATKPTSTVAVTRSTETTSTATIPITDQTSATIALVGIAVFAVVALAFRSLRKPGRLSKVDEGKEPNPER